MNKKSSQMQYTLDGEGKFLIRDYNHAKPFANFFPGIAGLCGIPMWVFYVNRGQCISSFGVESKDKAILEFQAANKAYRQTSLQGFRTFLKIKTGGKTILYEPFQNGFAVKPFKVSQNMAMSSHDLTIEETNHALGLVIRVNYFTLPEEPFAALIRQVSIKNISKKKYELELLDGLPVIVPYGLNDGLLKNMPRTAEAWVKVNNLKKKAPYYHLKVVISDKPEVQHIREGNFYFGFMPDEKGQKARLAEPIADPGCVFGQSQDFRVPEIFIKDNFKIPTHQNTLNQTPSALSYLKLSIPAGAEKRLIAACGYTVDVAQLNAIVRKVMAKGFIDKKNVANRAIIEGIRNNALTKSSSGEFDLYAQQTFLDNVLRGGLPISLKTEEGNIPFHVYSRKHGDPERDYNFFVLSPTFYSQGNGNYRDVNQNRRNDVWFNPDVRDDNVLNFMNLVQADGYNPLIVRGAKFSVHDPQSLRKLIRECVAEESGEKLQQILVEGFQPGSLLEKVKESKIQLKLPSADFLSRVLMYCHKQEEAAHGEGFWTDHWTYNLDLIQSYLALYPEKLKNLLLDKRNFTFYHNSHYVLPRDQRYILTPRGIRQYASVHDGSREIGADEKGNRLRIDSGSGEIYHTFLLTKLLCLIANKTASLDPSGVGVEMEADKPNWYDALNGLPGLLGSSISEAFEVKRFALFILSALEKAGIEEGESVEFFEELVHFIRGLNELLSVSPDALMYWQKSNDLKEQYRASVRLGLTGKEEQLSIGKVKEFLQRVIGKVDLGVDVVRDEKGLYPTYFVHEVTEFETLSGRSNDKFQYVQPVAFRRHALPLFLEGFVHGLRVERHPEQAGNLYRNVRKSVLFDKKLNMYKVNADLSGESEEIGRSRIFPRGWLENESIWLHMEYKFLLEILRSGLYEEFYQNFKKVLIPFLKPEQYGRSTLENSSFLVSSAHTDERLHGQGFVARLSGSTAEFMHIWLLMNAGPEPFFVNEQGALSVRFAPALTGELFSKEAGTAVVSDDKNLQEKIVLPKNTYAFKFLGSTLVVYHNPKRKDTFGRGAVEVRQIELSYRGQAQSKVLKTPVIPSPYAADIRSNRISRIDIFLE